MRIKQINVYSVDLAFKELFRIALGATEVNHNIIVRIATDSGLLGLGEASPFPQVTGETAETVVKTLDKMAPRLIGTSALGIEQNIEIMDSTVKGNPTAKAAVDIALHDILGKAANKPLFVLFGAYRTEVLTDLTLGIESPKEMVRNAVRAIRKGFKALKVKVGVNPAQDVERIRLIREAVDRCIQIRIDANQGWTTEQAIKVLNEIERFDIQFAEQPVPAEDIKGLAKVRKNSPIPIMADESAYSPQDVLRIAQAEAADLINIKLMKSGGILKARAISTVAEAAGMPCMIGCFGESGIGISAACHVAAGVKNIQFADLDSDLLLRDRLVRRGQVGIKESMRTLPRKHGLGITELDRKLLGKPIRIYS